MSVVALCLAHKQPKSLRLYGNFLKEIRNDEESGMVLLNRAQEIITAQNNSLKVDMMIGNNEENCEVPTAIISADLKSLGIVAMINTTLAKKFGFTKAELTQADVKGL